MNPQRGAGSGLTICIVVVVMMIAIVGAVQGSWLATGQRARSTADLVALVAGRQHVLTGDGCERAREVAADHAARLVSCELTTGYGEFTVDVTVEVDLVPALPGAPRTSRASSRAGIVEHSG